ncbi:MAG: lipopolysaccharide heptosyltransferase I [Acidobacteria bacterium]|nr:lipopolysaccharide heptosyltransferase I [Acidobacteriota bacterium]
MTTSHQSSDRGSKRVLLVRLGSMGDIVHALPALVTLKENFPAWELDWLVERRWRALLDENPCLTRVLEFDTLQWRAAPLSAATWSELGAAIRNMRGRHYDYALDLQGALKSAIACRLSGAREVIGFERPWLREPAASVLYTRRILHDAVHIVEANLALAAALGAGRPVVSFPLPAGDDSAVPPELGHRDQVMINPGAGWLAKQWPAAGYAEVCDEMEKRYSLPVVINCGPGETALAEAVRGACRHAHPVSYSGSLPGLIALLRRTRLMVGPDTGPLHLAAALQVPTVALFGPTDPRRNGPYGNSHRNLRAENAITSHRRSGRRDGGMDRIRPVQVLEAVRELLGEQGATGIRESSAATDSRFATS